MVLRSCQLISVGTRDRERERRQEPGRRAKRVRRARLEDVEDHTDDIWDDHDPHLGDDHDPDHTDVPESSSHVQPPTDEHTSEQTPIDHATDIEHTDSEQQPSSQQPPTDHVQHSDVIRDRPSRDPSVPSFDLGLTPTPQPPTEQPPPLQRAHRPTEISRDASVPLFDLGISPPQPDATAQGTDTSQVPVRHYVKRRSKRVPKPTKCGTDGEKGAKK